LAGKVGGRKVMLIALVALLVITPSFVGHTYEDGQYAERGLWLSTVLLLMAIFLILAGYIHD
jgi:hypothetical protein